MTIQANDDFIYNHKKYVLIDVEKDKQIINCAEFIMPEHSLSMCSACWRGYIVKYELVKGKLYGTRKEWDWKKHKNIQSKRVFMNYSGSCIIARETRGEIWHISDFLECYLDYSEALELHFTDGVLDEVLDLAEAIGEVEELRKKVDLSENDGKQYVASWYLGDIARKHLKYQYDIRSYKWR